MATFKSLLVLCIAGLTVSAQTAEDVTPGEGLTMRPIGFYMSPLCRLGSIAGFNAAIVGVEAGVLFNDRISITMTYNRTVTENTPVGETDTRIYLDGQWIGASCAYSILRIKSVSLNVPLGIGAGEIEFDLKEGYEHTGAATVPSGNAWYLYIEPGLLVEADVWKYIKFNIGAGYRITNAVLFRNLTERDLMGTTYSAGLKIGIF
jgi:hypothetical protein